MRLALFACLVAGLTTASCQSCPEGGSGDSLFCHADNDCSANETSCGGVCTSTDSDRDNCGMCGMVCGDGMSCNGGQCVDGCDNGEMTCAGACTDTTSDPTNCGACGSACATNETCASSACACPSGDLTTCGAPCTNPATDNTFCGATGDCQGANAGSACGSDQACVTGTCESTRIYRGSLTATVGRWTYGAVLGLNGANAACTAQFPGTQVCTATNLAAASAAHELVNATDFMGNPVTDWWIDDPLAILQERCGDDTTENIPWNYQTAHKGNVGKYVTLTAATGAITEVQTGSIAGGTGLCETARFVACCSIVVAP